MDVDSENFSYGGEHERGLVEAFFEPERRSRFLGLLRSEKGRRRLVSALPHLDTLDEMHVILVDPQQQRADAIEKELRRRGASETCYVLSENPRIDGRCMLLTEALGAVVGYGFATFISCKPGRLAYFEGESPGARYVCERSDGDT